MYIKTRQHWKRVRAHRFSNEPSIEKIMADAEKRAWNAMWRAYDFSVEALEERITSEKIRILQYIWNDWSSQRVKNIEGVNFFVTHLPRIGPSGEEIIRTESDDANAKHLIGEFQYKLLRDGTYLPNSESFKNLYPKAEEAYMLCDIAGTVQIDGYGFKTSRLDSVTISPGHLPVLTECSLSGNITQAKSETRSLPRAIQFKKTLDDLRIGGSASFSTPLLGDLDFFPIGFTTYLNLTISSPDSGRFCFNEQFSSVRLDLSRSTGRTYLSGKIKDLQITMGSSTADMRFEECDIETLIFYGEANFEILMTDSTIRRFWSFDEFLPRKLDIRNSNLGTDSYGSVLSVESATSNSQRCEKLSITGSRLNGFIDFSSQLFCAVNIINSVFSGHLIMRNSSVTGAFLLTSSAVNELDISCSQSLAEGHRTIGRLDLSGTTVELTAQFNNRIFDGTAKFDGSVFGTPPEFYGASLSQDTSFRNVRILWQQKLQSHGTPRNIIIKDLQRRLARKPRRKAIVRSIIARRRIYLGRWKGRTSFYERLKSALDVSVAIVAETLKASIGLIPHKKAVLESFDARNRYLAGVERAFRILRQKMDAIRAPALAESFGRDELRARHLRYGDNEVAIWEYIFSKIYSFTTDYGASVARPIAALGGLFVAMIFIYTLILGSVSYLCQAARVAMTISMRPLLHLGPAYGRNDPVCSTKLGTNADTFDTIAYLTNCNEVTFKAISFAHSIAVIILLFFAVGALRRRFRIG